MAVKRQPGVAFSPLSPALSRQGRGGCIVQTGKNPVEARPLVPGTQSERGACSRFQLFPMSRQLAQLPSPPAPLPQGVEDVLSKPARIPLRPELPRPWHARVRGFPWSRFQRLPMSPICTASPPLPSRERVGERGDLHQAKKNGPQAAFPGASGISERDRVQPLHHLAHGFRPLPHQSGASPLPADGWRQW